MWIIKKICKLCKKEFETVKYGEKRDYCFQCSPPGSSNSITIIRRKAKQLGVEQLGGKCKKCGESKSYLLDFHHRDPKEKESELSDLSKGYNLDKFFNELHKCDLLCANCHREFHYLHTFLNLSYEDFLNDNYSPVQTWLSWPKSPCRWFDSSLKHQAHVPCCTRSIRYRIGCLWDAMLA